MSSDFVRNLMRKVLSLLVLGKIYSNYKAHVYNVLIVGNPLTSIVKQLVASIMVDVKSIGPSFKQLVQQNGKATRGKALVSLNIAIFVVFIVKILRAIFGRKDNNNKSSSTTTRNNNNTYKASIAPE
jgi:hypothetical protein